MLQSYDQTTSSATRTAMGPDTESSPRRIWRCRYQAQAFTTSASTASPGSSLRKRKPSYCPRKPRPNAAPSEPSAGKQPAQDMAATRDPKLLVRSEEHTSELQSLLRISYAVFCLKKTN